MMTFYTEEADIPWFELPTGYKLVFEAISPTTGSAVASVSVSEVAVFGRTDADDDGTFESGPFVLVPGPGAGGDTTV